MKRIVTIISLVTTVVLSAKADDSAGSKFLQLSLTPNIALQSKETRIDGISLNIWGENPQSAFAWGFVNGSSGDSKGFSWGLVNYAENYKGVEWAFVNYTTGTFVGWQDGMVNIGKDVHGLQMGMINYTETLHGLQIGLINVVSTSPWFSDFPDKLAKGFVFVNWSF